MAAERKPSFHSALGISNIKNNIALVLDHDTPYASWVTLFRVTAKAHNVLDHIDEKVPKPTDIEDSLWLQVDAAVLQWIYSTVSREILLQILDSDDTALQAWNRVRDIFQDNKNTCAVYLEHEFSNCKLSGFSSINAYCLQLKSLADQLKGVGSPVPETRLVLQLISGLPAEYNAAASFIQQTDPLPSFTKARSQLLLEETRMTAQSAAGNTQSALTADSRSPPSAASSNQRTGSPAQPPSSSSSAAPDNQQSRRGRGRKGKQRQANGGGGSSRAAWHPSTLR